MIPSPMLMRGFVYPQHCPYPTGLFNHGSQSCRLGITSTGDYIFSPNVVLETLRLVNIGLLQARCFSDGLLTLSFALLKFKACILLNLKPYSLDDGCFQAYISILFLSVYSILKSLACFKLRCCTCCDFYCFSSS